MRRLPRRGAVAPAVLAFASIMGMAMLALAAPRADAQDGEDGLSSLFNMLLATSEPTMPPARPLAWSTPVAGQPYWPTAPLQASPAPETRVCPACGTLVIVEKAKEGAVWGYRLDLRRKGPVVDPAPLTLCPRCRYPLLSTIGAGAKAGIAGSAADVDEKLKKYVLSPEYAKLGSGQYPYFYLAWLRERGIVAAPKGAYDIAYTWLQASWQAEDAGNEGLRLDYLSRALAQAEKAARTAKKGDAHYASAHIMRGETLRLLSRFAEADAVFAPLEKAAEFGKPYLQRIVKAERALIAVESSAPEDSP